ncbi:hypothetical protein Y027_5403 [Burkholderia pseudomallei TSV5]|nr:hypothetical protein DP49_4249 [Burkholderia pseudomallei]KGX50649.1 hypothetical protein Y027_5403 [Burkholderia pseudomallei TSV5]
MKQIDSSCFPLRLHNEIEAGIVQVPFDGLLPFIRHRFDEVAENLDTSFGQTLSDARKRHASVAVVIASAARQQLLAVSQFLARLASGFDTLRQFRRLGRNSHQDTIFGPH